MEGPVLLEIKVNKGSRDDLGRPTTSPIDNKEELNQIKSIVGEENYNKGKFKDAADIFYSMSTSQEFEEFLTLPAYKLI